WRYVPRSRRKLPAMAQLPAARFAADEGIALPGKRLAGCQADAAFRARHQCTAASLARARGADLLPGDGAGHQQPCVAELPRDLPAAGVVRLRVATGGARLDPAVARRARHVSPPQPVAGDARIAVRRVAGAGARPPGSAGDVRIDAAGA